MNWLLKLWFYFRYLILKQGVIDSTTGILYKGRFTETTFYSDHFTDGRWNEYLPWYKDSEAFRDWNTYCTDYTSGFSQQYGRFYFEVRLDGLVTNTSWPAIWLFEMKSFTDVAEGLSDHAYYYEIDIELFKNHFGYTIHIDHDGKGKKVKRSLFANHKFRRRLQKEYHLFLIEWSKKWIKFYVDGILSARFRNEIHTPLQIIMSKLSMTKTIVEK